MSKEFCLRRVTREMPVRNPREMGSRHWVNVSGVQEGGSAEGMDLGV